MVSADETIPTQKFKNLQKDKEYLIGYYESI